MSEIDELFPSPDAPRVYSANRLGGSVRGDIVAGFAVLVLTTAALFMTAAVVKDALESQSEPPDRVEPGAALVVVQERDVDD